MHYHIYKHGESKCNDPTVDKAYWLDISSEHHRIYLNGCDHIPVKEDSEHCPCQDSYKGQQDIFPEYILGNLAIIKSQDLQCCKLSLTLCDIDVIQIIQYTNASIPAEMIRTQITAPREPSILST